MHRLTRHLRGLLVALATLALSAGVVVAARPASVDAPPAAATDGLEATEASGKSVPVRAEEPAAPEAAEDEDEGTDQEAPEVDAEGRRRGPGGGGGATPEPRLAVSEAAKATPASAENHGKYVSEIARSDAGKPEAATAARTGAPRLGGRQGQQAFAKGGNH